MIIIMHEYKNSVKHERTHTLFVHNEQRMWSLQLKFLLFKMLPVNAKLELELKFCFMSSTLVWYVMYALFLSLV